MILWSRIIFLMQFTINAITMTVSMTPNTRTMINIFSDCFSSPFVVIEIVKLAGNCHVNTLSITHRTFFRVFVPTEPTIHISIAPQFLLDASLIFAIVLVVSANAECLRENNKNGRDKAPKNGNKSWAEKNCIPTFSTFIPKSCVQNCKWWIDCHCLSKISNMYNVCFWLNRVGYRAAKVFESEGERREKFSF